MTVPSELQFASGKYFVTFVACLFLTPEGQADRLHYSSGMTMDDRGPGKLLILISIRIGAILNSSGPWGTTTGWDPRLVVRRRRPPVGIRPGAARSAGNAGACGSRRCKPPTILSPRRRRGDVDARLTCAHYQGAGRLF